MAGLEKRTHRIGRERIKYLRENGRPDERKIGVVIKAIRRECGNATITVNVRDNGTTEFVVTATTKQSELALRLIHIRLKGDPTPDPPQCVVALTKANVKEHNKNMVDKRLFACGPCSHAWWRKVFCIKPVSRCSRCHIRYDPVPKLLEFGHGRFRCPACGHEFTGRARAGVPAPCFNCGEMCEPESIGPSPRRDDDDQTRSSGRRHACQACDNGRIRPCPLYNALPTVSHRHDSTGSTVSTFLTQQTQPSEADFAVDDN